LSPRGPYRPAARPMMETSKRGASPREGDGSHPLGVILVDPYPIVREGIGMLVDVQPDFHVVVNAGSADEALGALRRLRRRGDLVAFVALELDGQHDGYWLIHELREQFPRIRIVASAASPDRMDVSRALFVGADGFIHKRADPVEFLVGLRRASAGEMVLAGVPQDWPRSSVCRSERSPPTSPTSTPSWG
jgi:DNA-binding NarL/FixJ family response regulator